MKTKQLIVSAILTCSALTASAALDGGSLLLGVIFGAAVSHNHPVQPTPVVVYSNPPPVVVIHESQAELYSPQYHGYCAPYTDEMYAQCMGNIKRQRLQEAYNRGLRGY